MEPKIPEKLQKMIDETLKKAFQNLIPIQVELLNSMFVTAYLYGVNDGVEITNAMFKNLTKPTNN